MKKFLVLAALALAVLGTATQADAKIRKVHEPLRWKTSNSAVAGGAWVASPDPQPLASGVLDTTVIFSLNSASPLGYGGWSGSTASQDTTLLGYVVAYQDSTADAANTLTAATATIEATYDGTDWTTVGSVACIGASDDPVVAFPLYQKNVSVTNGLHAAPKLRIRFASVTGILTACRLELVYWIDDSFETVNTQIPWATYPNGNASPTTNTQPIASEVLDTTSTFNLYDAYLNGLGGRKDGFAAQDSVLVGYMTIYSDSVADVSNTLTAVTVTIDGSADGTDWTVVGTGTSVGVSDDPVVSIPIIWRPGLDHQELLPLCRVLRARFTTVTGIMTAGRVRMLWWKNPSY